MDFTAVIVAAGSGTRAGPGGAKQWRALAGRAVVRWSAEALLGAGAARLAIVVPAGEETLAAEALAGLPRWLATAGGATRADSVRAGLAALDAEEDEIVLIHDAARPFVTARHVAALLGALEGADGAVPALPMADTVKREGEGGVSTVPRADLWRAHAKSPVVGLFRGPVIHPSRIRATGRCAFGPVMEI